MRNNWSNTPRKRARSNFPENVIKSIVALEGTVRKFRWFVQGF